MATKKDEQGGIPIAPYVEMLTKVDIDKSDAENKVIKMIQIVQKSIPDDLETQKSILQVKIKELARTIASVDKFAGICVAVGERADRNSYDKWIATQAYKDDPQAAVRDGKIAIEDDKPVPLDTRKFMDNAQKIPNKRCGKPLGIQYQRESLFIIDDELTRGFGDVDSEIGVQYDLFGKLNNGILNIKTHPAPIPQKTFSPIELWEKFDKIQGTLDNSIDVDEAMEAKPKESYIVKGIVTYVGTTGGGSTMIVLNDDEGSTDGLVCFVNSDMLEKHIADDEIKQGNEVFVIGRLNESKKDDEVSRNLSVTGVIKNPDSDKTSQVMSQLDQVMFGGA